MQIGNDDDGKFQTLRLMNRHQANNVSGLVQLTFALAATDFLELFHKMNEVADQLAGFFERLSKSKQLLDVRDALRAVKVRRDYSHEISLSHSETQKVG